MKFRITYYRTIYSILCSVIFFFLFSCKNSNPLGTLTIIESANIKRDIEYVEVEILINQLPQEDKALFLKDKKNEDLTKGQIIDSQKGISGKYAVRCLFPIHINALETKQYLIVLAENTELLTDLKVQGEGLELMIENNYFVANLTSEKSTVENELSSGQLTALTLKKFNNKKLQRSHINMHWAPNFQKEGLDYKTMGHIRQFDSVFVNNGQYMSTSYRSGKVKGYEEIMLEGKYQFFAGLPYFIFSSSMTMTKDVVLTMLRNDEMTMDSLFTHAMFPLPNGEVKTVPLYDKPPLKPHHSIKELRKTPIDTNTNWFCFYNDSLKYGFGSIRMQYNYTNVHGGQSPMLNPETRITYASNGARYWDRRFVFDKENSLSIPKGSKYTEKNAYVIFSINPKEPSKEIEELFLKLTHPLTLEYHEF